MVIYVINIFNSISKLGGGVMLALAHTFQGQKLIGVFFSSLPNCCRLWLKVKPTAKAQDPPAASSAQLQVYITHYWVLRSAFRSLC